MTLVREQPELDRPVEGIADLIDFFRVGETPPEEWRVGTEHEKLGLRRDTLEPIAYGDGRGLRRLLETFVERHGFAPLLEGDHLVGTEYEGQRITLEPGGQLELSGAPLYTLHETCREFRDHIALLNHVSAEMGVVWIGLGVHPFATADDVQWVPRDRHRIMREVLGRRGALAHHMMKATGGVQANFDYGDETDMAQKLRVSLAASPIVTALYANSSISEGKANGFLSRRAWIWRHTDPDRCGFLPFAFDEGWLEGGAYSLYTEWALDVPMLFIQRGGEHHPVGGKTFRGYLREGHGEHRATLADWNLHLTPLFPEVRLKRVIAVRGADAVPPGLVCGLPALWKGIFYDEEALGAAAARLRHWTFADVDRLHSDVSIRGLAAETPDGPVGALAQEIVDLAAKGLRRQGARNAAGEDETLFLDPLYEVLDQGKSAARQLLERWQGPWGGKAERLVEYAAY
jgi:glutamate--cysteine ligase